MARKRELELEVLRLQLQLDQAAINLENVREERGQYIEKANNIEWELRSSRDQAKDLQEQVQKLVVEKAVLMERLELVAAGIGQPAGLSPAEGSPLPNPNSAEPEEIEDARFALSMGRINHGEFKKILENFGFSNTEVQIDGTPGFPQY